MASVNAADGEYHLLRCVVFGAASRPFLSRLCREKGIWSVFLTGSRRAVADHSHTRAKVVEFVENEEIFILCPAERVPEIMEFCWIELNMDQPGRGMIYASPIDMAVPLTMPKEAHENAPSL